MRSSLKPHTINLPYTALKHGHRTRAHVRSAQMALHLTLLGAVTALIQKSHSKYI